MMEKIKKMKKNKLFHRFCAWLMTIALCFQASAPAMAAPAQDTIYIKSEEDLVELSRNCSYDIWSQGKTVILQADIILEEGEFLPIPTFGGTFDGNGHFIRGLNIKDNISPAGLFGIVQKGAVIENLTVYGKILLGSANSNTGGIAGINYGTIKNCSFSGSLTGNENVGGIAGSNMQTGKVEKCTVSGRIQGEKMTGGIAGYNEGAIVSCESKSTVNAKSVDPALKLDNIDTTTKEGVLRIASLDTINVASDTGGIAGGSTGMIVGCTNEGTIGYQHIGYNVGGIAGRSSGYISNCENKGRVYGRKDVGGIIGQVVSHITMKLSEDMLGRIQREMEELSRLVDKAGEDAKGASGTISDHISDINNSLGNATDSTKELADSLGEYGDSVAEEINRGSEIIEETLNQLAEISNRIEEDSKDVTAALDLLEKSIDEMSKASQFSTAAIADMRLAVSDLETALSLLESGTRKINSGIDKLEDTVKVKDEQAAKAAWEQIQEGVTDCTNALKNLSASLEKLSGAIENTPIDSDKVEEALGEMSEAFGASADAMEKISNGITVLKENISFDLESLKAGIDKIQAGVKDYEGGFRYFNLAMKHMDDALADLQLTSQQLTTAVNSLKETVAAFESISGKMTDRFSDVADLLDYLENAEAIAIAKPGEATQESIDSLYSSMNTMNQQVEDLNKDINSATDVLIEDIQAINHQFMNVMDVFIAAVYETESTSADDYFIDTSAENIDSVTTGKTCDSINSGSIYGDINVGGISGSMGIEDEMDPESDIKVNASSGYKKRYEMKAILQKCTNKGKIISRRNYAGAVCGRMDFGLITECEGYGTVESELGNYVGGIAGFNSGTVQNSFAKCSLSGKKYVGGIVGSGITEEGEDADGTVAGCYSLVEVTDSEQYAGAISGIDSGSFIKNYFVSDELAGIDRVSLSGKAQPLSYKELLKTEGLPAEFKEFTLRFVADGKVMKTETFKYGESFDDDIFPEAVPKRGHYVEWDRKELKNLRFDTDVNAVYTQYVTALESENKREGKRPVFFVEGKFNLEDEVDAKEGLAEEALDGLSLGNRKLVEQWSLEIPEDGAKAHTVRYLPSEEKINKLVICVKQDDEWKEVKTESIGSYLAFDVEDQDVEIVVLKKPFWHFW